MDPMLAFALPGGALAFGVVVFVIHKLSMWRFNQRHPHLRRGFDGPDVAQVSLKPVSTAMTSTEALDEAQADATVTANQNAPRSTSVKDAFNTVVTMETVERLKRAGLVVTSGSAVTFNGQMRAHSNILPPRTSPRGRRDEGTTATPE